MPVPGGLPWFALGAGCPAVSKVLGALILAPPGSPHQLPSGHKVVLEVLLGYTGCRAGEKRSRLELGEVQPHC